MSSLSNKYKNVTMDKHDIKTKTLEYDLEYYIHNFKEDKIWAV